MYSLDQVAVLGVFTEAVTTLDALGIKNKVIVERTSSFRKLAELMKVSQEDLLRCVSEGFCSSLFGPYDMHVWCNKENVQKKAWLKMVSIRPDGDVAILTDLLAVLD